MSNEADKITRALARQAGGSLLDAFKPAPPPAPAKPKLPKLPSVAKVQKQLDMLDELLGKPTKDKTPKRPPVDGSDEGDIADLNACEVMRGDTFDRWCRRALFMLLVKGYDPLYEQAAGIYMNKKIAAHIK